MSEFLNKTQLAKEMGVSIPTINSWLRRGMPYVKKGSQDNESWQFDADECGAWYEDYKKIYQGEVVHNIFKILTSLTAYELFSFLTELAGEPKIVNFIAEKNKLKKSQMEQIYFDLYHLLTHYFLNEWVKDNLADKSCQEQLGFSFDELFRLSHPNAKVSNDNKVYSHELRVPEVIERIHKKLKAEVKK